MAKRTSKLKIFPADGGLQSAINPALINHQNLVQCDNVVFTNDATRKNRPGLRNFEQSGITETESFRYLFDFWRQSAAGAQAHSVIAVVNGKAFEDGGGDGIFTDVTGGVSLNASDVMTSDVFASLLLVARTTGAPVRKANAGNFVALGGTPPEGSLVRVHRNFAWLAGVPNLPHRLYRSAVNDPETWTGAGTESIDIDAGDGDPEGITAIFPSFYGDLFVAKRRSIYRLSVASLAPVTFRIDQVVRGVGCVSHNSVIALQNDIIFVSERGVHSLAKTQKLGDVETGFLSEPIHDIFTDDFDYSRASQVQSVYSPELNSYLMSFPSRASADNDTVIGYNIVTGQWYRWPDFSSSAMAQFVDSDSKTKIMVGQSDGSLGLLDEGRNVDYSTTAIHSIFKTGILYPFIDENGRPDPSKTVAFKRLVVIYRPQQTSTFTVKASISGGVGSTLSETLTFDQSGGSGTPLGEFIVGRSTLGTSGQVRIDSQPLNGAGRGIQLTFSRAPTSGNITRGMEILGYIVEFIDAGDSDLPTVQ